MTNRSVDPDIAAIPLTALVPEETSGPITVLAKQTALRMAIVRPGQVRSLNDEWSEPGVYVLLNQHATDGTWNTYVGKAAGTDGLAGRLKSHSKKDWYRAVLVKRDTTEGFNSAEVGWLEGRLYDLLDAAEYANLDNKDRPGDKTLQPYEQQMLQTLIPPIGSLLALIGHNTATADDEDATTDSEKPSQHEQRRSRFYGITVKDLLEAEYLKPGELLVSTNGRWPATARVTNEGHIEQGGISYETPSPAASAAAHGGAMAGWDFWAIQDETGTVALKTLRARYLKDRSGSNDQHR